MDSEKLLEEFPPVSTQAWEEAIQADLKGADYAKKLIWRTAEGLPVKPYYRAADIAHLQLAGETPGTFPYLRGTRSTGEWRIREEIDAADPEQANHAAVCAIGCGAEQISYNNVVVRNASDLKMLLANTGTAPVHFEHAGEPLIRVLLEHLRSSSEHREISTGWSPLENFDFAALVLENGFSQFVPFTLNGESLEESGASAVEEVGYMLAAGIEFLRAMQERNVKIDRAAAAIEFSFSIGSSYFIQIAKFRAFRAAWAQAVESFGGRHEIGKARIHARTSRWNKTIYDPHVNVLRATTEAMSAALGGADSICVAPFDACYRTPDEASRRLARNTQLILKREALLERVADPGAGSYSLEVMTDFLARQGWQRMQLIEANGGYGKARAGGLIDKALYALGDARDKAVSSRRRPFTGTSQFANPAERVLDWIEPLHSESRRGAQTYERIRLRTERHAALTGHAPTVLLAEFGDVKMRGARSNFAANFWACAGFAIITQRVESAFEVAATNADLIVLCSSDVEYLAMATAVMKQLKAAERETPVVIAGNPESAEQLKAIGVADFIHVRSNPVEVLASWQDRLGIEACR